MLLPVRHGSARTFIVRTLVVLTDASSAATRPDPPGFYRHLPDTSLPPAVPAGCYLTPARCQQPFDIHTRYTYAPRPGCLHHRDVDFARCSRRPTAPAPTTPTYAFYRFFAHYLHLDNGCIRLHAVYLYKRTFLGCCPATPLPCPG